MKLFLQTLFGRSAVGTWLLLFSSWMAGQPLDDSLMVKRVSLVNQEFADRQRLILSLPQEEDKLTVVFPRIEQDTAAGVFSLTLSPMDTALFIGKRSRKLWGEIPLQLAVQFPDSETVLISGQTFPYSDLVCFYQLAEQQLVCDLFPNPAPEEALLMTGTTADSFGVDDNIPAIPYGDSPRSLQLQKQMELYRQDLFKTRIYVSTALAICVLLLTVTILLLIRRGSTGQIRRHKVPRRKKPSSSDLKSASAPEPQAPQVKSGIEQTPEQREMLIARLMRERNISYDEANLIVNMQQTRLNVKA